MGLGVPRIVARPPTQVNAEGCGIVEAGMQECEGEDAGMWRRGFSPAGDAGMWRRGFSPAILRP